MWTTIRCQPTDMQNLEVSLAITAKKTTYELGDGTTVLLFSASDSKLTCTLLLSLAETSQCMPIIDNWSTRLLIDCSGGVPESAFIAQ